MNKILLALIWPILIWALIVGIKSYAFYGGHSLTLPVHGYDPRDLLSGHYIIYEIDYGNSLYNCSYNPSYLLYPGTAKAQLSYHPPEQGEVYIAGYCKNRRFIADIERYYVPEQYAARLDRLLRSRQVTASIELSVMSDGSAQVKNFMLDGKPWRSFLEREQEE